MKRPPLANLFAVFDENPAVLKEIMKGIERSREFVEVFKPIPDWVVAIAPLPDSEPDGEAARRFGLVFAEGRDILEKGANDRAQRFREIAEFADKKTENLDTFPGDFGFIRFHPQGPVTVVRSCSGLAPFYIKQDGKRTVISTRLEYFVRYHPDEPRLDPLSNAVWASSWPTFPDGRTPLKDVKILARGSFAKIENGRVTTGRYWNPRPEKIHYPTPTEADEHARRLREILLEKLQRDLDPRGGNLLTLSGGVDSSSLCALSAGLLGFKVMTWSTLHSKENNEKAYRHDLSYIEPLRRQYGIEKYWEAFVPKTGAVEFWLKGPRFVFHVLHPALCSLPDVLKEADVNVLFGGEYADKVCGQSFTVPDWARQTSLFRVLTDVRGLLREPKDPVRWLKQKFYLWRGEPQMPIPQNLLTGSRGVSRKNERPLEFFTKEVIEEYQEWYDRQKKRLLEDRRPWRYLAIDSEIMDSFVTMNWEACSALGIRRSLPFFTREVFELTFSCHPVELYGGGVKKLIRRALVNDVPHRNLFRADKGAGPGRGQITSSFESFSRSFKAPFPVETLPEELRGIIKEEWFSHPPKELEYWQYRPLMRLLIFFESLRARRQERRGTASGKR